ncbi:unnamed protein product, partial [marine sediment metagenome]
YKTLQDYKLVAQKFQLSERSYNLSWSHHQAVAYQPRPVRRKLLAEAEPDAHDQPPKLSVSEVKKEAKRISRETNTPALPTDKYRVIYADPPWEYNDERAGTSAGGSAAAQYELMPTDCIAALCTNGRTIRDIAAKDSVLFLWSTVPLLPDALRVIAAWGFKYKTYFVWDKVLQYVGSYSGVRHESLILATRGSCTPNEGSFSDSVVQIKRTVHSKKPEEFYELIESLYPDGPYIELFARNTRD